MKLSKYNLKIIRDFKRSKFQFIAIIIVIILGVGLYIGLSASFLDLSTSYNYTYDRLNLAHFSIYVQSAPEKVLRKIKYADNISRVSGELEYEVGYERTRYKKAILKLVGIGSDQSINQIYVSEGRNFKPKEEDRVGIIISQFADYNNIKVGDEIEIKIKEREIKIKIIGVATSPDNLIVVMGKQNPLPSPSIYGILYMPLSQLQELTGLDNQINKINVIVKDKSKVNYTMENIKSMLDSFNIISDAERKDFPSVNMLKLDLEGFDKISKFFPILFYIIASFSIYIMLTRLIMSQRREIGIARAIGYSKREVLLHYVKYSIFIILIGSVLGIILGLFMSKSITRIYADTLGIPFVSSKVYPNIILQGVGISFVFGIISAIMPARLTLSVKPAEVMRMSEEGRFNFKADSIFERITRKMLGFSLIGKLAVRNIFRNKKRSFFTMLGIVFSIILLLVSISWYDSMEGMLDKWHSKVEKWNLQAVGNMNISEDELDDISRWEGIEIAEPLINKEARFKLGYDEYNGSVKGIIKNSNLHQFYSESGKNLKLEDGKTILNSGLKYKIDVQYGDILTIENNSGDKMEFEVAGFTDEIIGLSAYLTYRDAQKLFNMRDMASNILLKVDKDYLNRVSDRLFNEYYSGIVINKVDILKDIEELMSLMYSFIYIMIFFGSILAFSLIFNTVTVNVLERQREYATMRMLGARYTLPFRILAIENLIIAISGIIPGIVLGYIIARYSITLFNSELFTMEFYLFPRTYIIILVTIFMVLFLSQLPSMVYIKKLDIVKIAKEKIS